MPVLTDVEFDAVEKVLQGSHMDDSFDILQTDNFFDITYSFEEERAYPLQEGLTWMFDGFYNKDNVYGLTVQEAEALIRLHKRLDLNILHPKTSAVDLLG